MASPLTEIPDHLLVEILLRLPDSEDLARTSAACGSFHQLATDGSFLRRFRRLHAPPLLGFLRAGGMFRPTMPPHPSAHALALMTDFYFSFIHSQCHWTVQDIRDGHVLLDRDLRQDERHPVFKDLAVCDPLHRGYVLLPQLPHDIGASLECPFPPVRKAWCKPFLVPLGEEEAAAGETSFRVILMAHCKTSLAAFVFSSSTGQWQAAASKGWGDLALSERAWPGCHGSTLLFSGAIMLMDASTGTGWNSGARSCSCLTPGIWSSGEGRLGMFGFRGETASDLSYTVAWNNGKSPRQWQVEKTISLDSGYGYCIRDATERYLLLTRTKASSLENPLVGYFSMDVKTLQLQRLYDDPQYLMYETYTYINYPPSLLSSRRI